MRSEHNPDYEETTLPYELDDGEENEKQVRGAKIELRNVWFKYPTRDVMVLNGLNMIVSLDGNCVHNRDADSK